ncbi:hypothetical protein ABZX51_007312 [Aspergillus tubingensis]
MAIFIFTIPSCLSKVMRSADRVGIPHTRVFLLEGRQDSQTTLQDCIDIGRSYGPGGQEGSFKILDGSSNRDSCGYLNFSSGTTGRPKAHSACKLGKRLTSRTVYPLTVSLQPAAIRTIMLINKGLRIRGSLVASRGDLAKMLQFCADKGVRPATSNFSLTSTEEVNQAMESLQRNTVRYKALLVADEHPLKL